MALVCMWPAVRAQDTAKTLQKMAADADPDWDVVTVKPSDPDKGYTAFNVRGRNVLIENQTVEEMVKFAYSLDGRQIIGAPDRVSAERYDVSGVPDVPGEPNLRQFQSMVRKLLAERFGLRLHHEQREMQVLALTVARGGLKLTPNGTDPDGFPDHVGHGGSGQRTHDFKNTSMHDLALTLLFLTDRPVVDQTGLQGRYDFTLKYTNDESKAATDGSAPPGLFTAIQEQLGLKLEATKAPADVLVIDKVERPGAN
jgi:uncharacterized protein (TIGR03435 family)